MRDVEIAMTEAVRAMGQEAAREDATPQGVAARTIEAFLRAMPSDRWGTRGGPSLRLLAGGGTAHELGSLADSVSRFRARKEKADHD